jgi:hypothetical protein
MGGDRRIPLLTAGDDTARSPLILGGCAILLWFGMWRDQGRGGGPPMPKLSRPAKRGPSRVTAELRG